MGVDATNLVNAGINAGIDAGMNYVEGMLPAEVTETLDKLKGIASEVQDKVSGIMDKLSEFNTYKPEDPFDKEDRENGITPSQEEDKDEEEIVSEENTGDEEEEELTPARKLKKKFQEDMEGLIPGLDPDSILDALAERCKPLQMAMQPIMDSIYYIRENKKLPPEVKEARIALLKEQKKQQLKAWKDSQKDYVTHIINDIKADFEEIKYGVENVAVMVPIIITQINLPTFIGTGAPNPARIVADFLSYKHMLQFMTHPITTAVNKLLDNCDRIGFTLPEPALKIVESVSKIVGVIDQIPG